MLHTAVSYVAVDVNGRFTDSLTVQVDIKHSRFDRDPFESNFLVIAQSGRIKLMARPVLRLKALRFYYLCWRRFAVDMIVVITFHQQLVDLFICFGEFIFQFVNAYRLRFDFDPERIEFRLHLSHQRSNILK